MKRLGKFVVSISAALFLFSALILFALVSVSIPFYCDEEKLPTEESLQYYLRRANKEIVPALREELMSIKDKESAIGSVPRLIQLGESCSHIYEASSTYQTIQSHEDFSTKVVRLIQQEMAFKPTDVMMYDDILREYKRLDSYNFYESRILKATLRSYFFEKVDDTIFPIWQPMSMIRYNLAKQHLLINSKSIEKLFSQLYNNAIAQDSREDIIYVLLLDYYNHANICRRGDFSLVSPAKPTIRGRGAIFDNCFCDRYCFNKKEPKRFHLISLEDMLATELHSFSVENASQLEGFICKIQDSGDGKVSFIYRLSPPFKSTYLILDFDRGERYCSSIWFSDEYPLTHHAVRKL